MKSLSSLTQFALVMAAVGSFLLPNDSEIPKSSNSQVSLVSSPALQLCECEGKVTGDCNCAPCFCKEPLKVGQPPDLVNISHGQVVPVALVAEPKFMPPPPPPVVKQAPAAPSGHYETVYAGFRGRRSYQVWVADSSSRQACSISNQACSNGSCASPTACANGSCQVQGYSGGCASCGRGRR